MNTRATVWADTASQPINPFTLCLERFLQPPLQKKLEKKKKDIPEKETTQDNAPARSGLLHYLGRQKPAHITCTSKSQT